MKYELFDYQRAAAVECLDRLIRGRDDSDKGYLSSFALSAITGSGKTVIATAAIEGLLHGSADLEVEADPRATFLWVTDDPALNNQTRNKMLQASDLLQPARLRILDNDFLDSELMPGRVYFLNIQKLSKNCRARAGRAQPSSALDVGRLGEHHPRRQQRPVPRARRSTSWDEAAARSPVDRPADHQRRARLEPTHARRLGHLGDDRPLHGRNEGDLGANRVPVRAGRHRQGPCFGPRQG